MSRALKAWLKKTGRTPRFLANELQAAGFPASESLVKAVIRREKRFGMDTIYHLQKLSNWQVNFDNLYIPLSRLKAANNSVDAASDV